MAHHPRRGPNVRTLSGSQSHTQLLPAPPTPPIAPPYVSVLYPNNAPVPPSGEVIELRRRVEDQERRIDVLTRSLEALVVNYTTDHAELEKLRESQRQTSERVNDVQSQVKKVDGNNKKIEARVGELDYKASVAFVNSTAEDEAQQFMYDERNMIGNDTPMSNEEFMALNEKFQKGRGPRRGK